MRSSKQQSGFTLIELMIAVALIGIVTAAAAPSVMTNLADNRVRRGAIHSVRAFQFARAESLAHARAHIVRFSTTNFGGDGGLASFRGDTGNCNTSDWATILATDCAVNPENCLLGGFVDMGEYSLSAYTTSMTADFPAPIGAVDTVDVCFDSSGRVSYRLGTVATTNGLFVDWNTSQASGAGSTESADINGALSFKVERVDSSGTAQGVARRLRVSLGGDAWLVN